MATLLRTLVALVTGAIAALLWVERQTASRPAPPAPQPPKPPPEPERVVETVVEEVVVPDPQQAARIAELEAELAEQRTLRTPPPQPAPPPEPERVVETVVEKVTETVVEEVVVPDPEQTARIEALEAELQAQRAIRASEPDEPPPSVDAIRAARARSFELERRLSQSDSLTGPSWTQLAPQSTDELIEAAAEHLPRVALHSAPDSADLAPIWRTLGAMQEFAEACEGDWFEFHGDFARWCAESGHPEAIDGERCQLDEHRPTFTVEARVNRSGQMVVPTYVEAGETRCYYVDDVAGESGRMHVVDIC